MKFYKILLMLLLIISQISNSYFHIVFTGKGAQERLNKDIRSGFWIASYTTPDGNESILELFPNKRTYIKEMKSNTIISLPYHLGLITNLTVHNELSRDEIHIRVKDRYCYIFKYNESNDKWALDLTQSLEEEYVYKFLKDNLQRAADNEAKAKVKEFYQAEAKRAIDAIQADL